MSWKDVRCALREAFSHWGFPLRVRTDRGKQFIGTERSVMPSLFSLWLVGLGIEHRLNEKPHSPQLNGGVERMHRTLGDRVWRDAHFDSLQSLSFIGPTSRCQPASMDHPPSNPQAAAIDLDPPTKLGLIDLRDPLARRAEAHARVGQFKESAADWERLRTRGRLGRRRTAVLHKPGRRRR